MACLSALKINYVSNHVGKTQGTSKKIAEKNVSIITEDLVHEELFTVNLSLLLSLKN